MMFRGIGRRGQEAIKRLTDEYEKKIYDLQQLIEISKSLNSTLDYNNLVQSILYICMGQLKMLRAGLFTRKDIDKQSLILHRSMVGFEVDHQDEYIIPEGHELLRYLQDHFTCHTYEELLRAVPELGQLHAVYSLEPYLIVPLRSKTVVNGVLVLGDPIEGLEISDQDRRYVMDIATLAGIAVHNAFLYEITTTDIMTKLKLRHFFIDNLQDTMLVSRKEKRKLSLVMLDIDHFKNLNDTYGHLCGDMVIRQVSQVMLDSVRQTDLAARYGGEEFVLMLPDTDIHTAIAISERIRITIAEQEYEYNGQIIHLTVSMGVAEYHAQIDQNTFTFINRADNAMYASKHAGRNRVTSATLPETVG
jgi:two-component system cell cycle response regulator